MALASLPAAPVDMAIEDDLNEEIAQVRAEIQKLSQSRKLLKASLLATTKVQSRLATVSRHDTVSFDVSNIKEHCTSNVHRLAFGVTSFPFNDPSPELQSKNPLLGIRFDVCNRQGKFDSPYYIFCIRNNDQSQDLRIHRHTIPAWVPLSQYEEKYLDESRPTAEDEGYGGSDDFTHSVGSEGKQPEQDLRGLVARVRSDLVSWRARQDSANWLREELGLGKAPGEELKGDRGKPQPDEDIAMADQASPDETAEEDGDDASGSDVEDDEPLGRFDIISLTTPTVDARQIKIIWADDSVGILKIAEDGKVEKAAVFSQGGTRANDIERILMGGDGQDVMVQDLLPKLEMVHTKKLSSQDEASGRRLENQP